MTDFADAEVVAGASGIARRGSYRINSAVPRGDHLDLRLAIDGSSKLFGLEVPLPSSKDIQWWLYLPARTADDWLGMLMTWIDEQVETNAANWAELRERDGVHYFVVEPYGVKHSDPTEHARLKAAFPVLGWDAYPQG